MCPEWCCHEHLGHESDGCGIHHDGPTLTVALDEELVGGREFDLFVNVSQHVQADGPPGPPLVEVQDAHRTLVLLSPSECLDLSQALLQAAVECARATEQTRERLAAVTVELERVVRTSRALIEEFVDPVRGS
jgi:hypothetical protein